MAQMILYATENATTGITLDKWIAAGGIQRTREDIDGNNAGRMKTGTMVRDRIATKRKYTVNLRPILQTDLQPILSIIEQEYFWASYNDNTLGWRTKVKFYSNNNTSTTETEFPDGDILVGGVSFPVIEV